MRNVAHLGMIVIGATAFLSVRVGISEQHNTVDRTFSQPDRIRYDSRSLIIDGKPVFIFSGELHYFRCPRELWTDRMQKMKDAGLNCVDTYLAWNLHEPEEPANPDDFSKLQDMQQISDFIQAAQDLGLYVMIRPGPYICAEVDRGGLPGWLMKYRPDGLRLGHFSAGQLAGNVGVGPALAYGGRQSRQAAPDYERAQGFNWRDSVAIGERVRLERCRTHFGRTRRCVRALAHASLDGGIDVPLFTCETMDQAFRDDPFLCSHVFDTVNKYPNYDMQPLIEGIEGRAQYQPETFRGITELQGGWFSQVGGTLSGGHNAAQITQVTLTAIERGCTMINYYMFYGGSNFGYTAACTATQSYDYNAPLREWGGQGDRYYAVKAIGRMLKEHGQRLIHSDPVELTVEGDHSDVSIYLRRSEDGSQFYFVRNSQEHEPRSGTVTLRPKGGAGTKTELQLGQLRGEGAVCSARHKRFSRRRVVAEASRDDRCFAVHAGTSTGACGFDRRRRTLK